MASIKNNYIFQLAGDLPSSGTSVAISVDLERSNTVTFTNAYVVLRSGNKIERIKATASGGTMSISKRGLDETDTDVEVTSLKKDWKEGTTCYVTILASQLQDVLDTINTGALLPPTYANDTARDTAITSPVNGMIVYNEDDGFLNKYVGGAWVDDEGGAVVANASTTVAGKVEEATDAEFTAGTNTGGTGAKLFATLVQLAKSISLKPLVTVTTPSSDKIAVSYSDGSDKSILISDFVNQVPATTSTKGFARMSTNDGVITGTNESDYINPKQANDVYTTKRQYGVVTMATNATSTSTITLSGFVKAPKVIKVYATDDRGGPYEIGVWNNGIYQGRQSDVNTAGSGTIAAITNALYRRFNTSNNGNATLTVSSITNTGFNIVMTNVGGTVSGVGGRNGGDMMREAIQ